MKTFTVLISIICAHISLQAVLPADSLQKQQKEAFELLQASLQGATVTDFESFYRVSESIDYGTHLVLDEASRLLIGRSYRSTVAQWQKNERLKVYYCPQYSNNIQIDNLDRKESAWGIYDNYPSTAIYYVSRLSKSILEPDNQTKLILNNGMILLGPKVLWSLRDHIFIFHGLNETYGLWNLTRNEYIKDWAYLGNENEGSADSIVNLEKQINSQILGQQDVVKTIVKTYFNCWSGLNNPKTPIAAFLFLGPTGVGKTEIAKVLAHLLYRDTLIRFDMSQFLSSVDCTRFIGAAPGYANHEEGGQLTEAVRKNPKSVVLFDEIEKAYPTIYKILLPVLDEGYIFDAKNRKIDCHYVTFIMTGNICSNEIAEFYKQGLSNEEILKKIEPLLVQALSPELYNRTLPLLFRPLNPDLMESLVKQKLGRLATHLKQSKNIDLTFDSKVINYLATKGFHPTLGARPLLRLIENKVVSFLSYSIVYDAIPDGAKITLNYNDTNDLWHVTMD